MEHRDLPRQQSEGPSVCRLQGKQPMCLFPSGIFFFFFGSEFFEKIHSKLALRSVNPVGKRKVVRRSYSLSLV
jgi:hypothetical protein